MEVATKLAAELGAHLDVREGQTPGTKFFHWDRRGLLGVFELGPRSPQARS
jgi:prolyl-tRNA synthetase